MSINYTNANSIFITIGRMNPPTPGHLKVVRNLIENANARGVSEVYVILTTTNNTPDNPIVCQDKRSVLGDGGNDPGTMIYNLKQMMQNETQDPGKKQTIADTIVHVICADKGPFVAISSLVNEKTDVNLFIILGEDREDMIDSITKFYAKLPNVHSVDRYAIKRANMDSIKLQSNDPASLQNLLNTTKMSDIVNNGMSASFVRSIATPATQNKFIELYSPYLDENKINDLYEEILDGMTSVTLKKTPAASKSKAKPKYVSPYTYPVVKDADMDMGESLLMKRKLSDISGGKTKRARKKRTKKRKRTRKTKKRKTKRKSRK